MKQFSLLGLLALLFLVASVSFAQEEADQAPAEDGAEDGAEGEEKQEECEEAWEYLEFMKANIKDKIEVVLQETLFQPKPLLEETVTQTMEKVLEIRDDILTRTKSIRTGDGEITICPEQNIKQEEFLTQIRMQVMGILLSLIEKDAASPEKLQDIGKQLLAIRSKVNIEITRMIMLRETQASVRRVEKSECDCGILDEVVDGLDQVINKDEDKKEEGEVTEEGDDEDQEEGGDEGAEDSEAGGEGGSAIEQLTMILMTVDAEIKTLYNQILAELDDELREQLALELQNLKGISTDLHEVLSKLSSLDPEEDVEAIDRLVRREVRGIRNDVKRLLDQCQENCPGECDSCGAEKIDEISEKLKDYKANLEDLEEQDALPTIRTDLMGFLGEISSEMTDLLKEKAENNELDKCGNEKLEVINKIKGPLWMAVNVTIFGTSEVMTEMLQAIEDVLPELRSQYCGAEEIPAPVERIVTDECDSNEINAARDYISDLDEIISNDIFKNQDDEGRKNAMLGLIELKAAMDKRVSELFEDNLQCNEEVEQIKNIYISKLTECLSEMMNPRFRFDLLGRADRVQCVKDLRILMEDRRGVLLMREIENRINQADGAEAVGDDDGEATES